MVFSFVIVTFKVWNTWGAFETPQASYLCFEWKAHHPRQPGRYLYSVGLICWIFLSRKWKLLGALPVSCSLLIIDAPKFRMSSDCSFDSGMEPALMHLCLNHKSQVVNLHENNTLFMSHIPTGFICDSSKWDTDQTNKQTNKKTKKPSHWN